MRLDIEQAKKYLQGMYRMWLCEEWEHPYNSEHCRGCDSHDNCLDIVLSATCMSDIAQDLLDTIEALQHENEQLRAQVAKMQEVLRGIEKEYVTDFTDEELDERLCPRDNAILNYWVRPVLNYGTVNYHNPADVEALEQAREAFQDCIAYGFFKDDFNFNKTTCYIAIKEAIAEIDKAIGGKGSEK